VNLSSLLEEKKSLSSKIAVDKNDKAMSESGMFVSTAKAEEGESATNVPETYDEILLTLSFCVENL